ncbi:hypothetical protein LTR29_005461 [Friedmanniomyces endolithicus]|nr:hypothetical protein LTS09_004045 [Friedmanniomyces endolithicus]KAK0943081.1 hypothetical protein LTR29_005461 [Friedmanniomyces endolithicus]
MPPPHKVLISGAGIAGSVLAFWLHRASPTTQITLIERAPALRLTGASVDIRGSAIDVVKLMGVLDKIREQTTREAGVQCVRADGSTAWQLGATGREEMQSVTSEYEIFRGALARILLEPIKGKVELVLGEWVEGFEQADGVGSRVRGLMLEAPSREQVVDLGCHVAYFTVKSDLLSGGQWAKWCNSPGGRVTFLRPDPDPRGRTRAYLCNVTLPAQTKERDRLNEALEQGDKAYMTMLEDLFKDAGWLAPEVLKSMRESDDFYCSLFAQTRSPKLCNGRVVLLGDAGYATPGIGTSLAIIGGYVLAGEILRHDGDVVKACKAYEDLMLPYAKSQQKGGGAMRYANPQTAWGIAARNAVMGAATGLMLDRVVMAGAAWLGFSERKLAMPEYPWPAQ